MGTREERELDALRDVLTIQPTTLAGVAALLAHLGQPEWFEECDDPELAQSILSGAAESPAREEARLLPARLAETLRRLIAEGRS